MKHLYYRSGKAKLHSDLCWCEQITKWQNKPLDSILSENGRKEMLYPHEADETYCRCPRPAIREARKDLEVCRLCGKPLEKKD